MLLKIFSNSKVSVFFILMLLSLLYLFLTLNYKSALIEVFKHERYTYDFNLIRFTGIFFLYVMINLSLFMIRKDYIFFSLLSLFTLFSFIPISIIYFSSDKPFTPVLACLIFFFTVFSFSKISLQLVFLRISQIDKKIIAFLILILSWIICIVLFKFQFNLTNFLIDNIYDVREEFVVKNTGIGIYVFSILSVAVLPTVTLYGLSIKNFTIVGLGMLLFLYLFLVGGHKSTIVTMLIVVIFYYLGNTSHKIIFRLFFGLLLIIGLFYFFTAREENSVILDILLRRSFFTPANILFHYFDFFNDTKLHLSHSIFKAFSTYPYNLPPARMIGLTYMGSELWNANSGVIADGYMNFGIVGIFIYSAIVGFIFLLIKSMRAGVIIIGLIFVQLQLIMEAFLTTWFLSYGLFVFLFLCYIFFSKHEKINGLN
jgi:oligosaccharide repeat unit polymerase